MSPKQRPAAERCCRNSDREVTRSDGLASGDGRGDRVTRNHSCGQPGADNVFVAKQSSEADTSRRLPRRHGA